ncbi:hypothetical protein GW765_00575 [Candidatus Parcubacteria bacterium]|nr:hypothetical protein [Candidatus Parcubacteria bacterium]
MDTNDTNTNAAATDTPVVEAIATPVAEENSAEATPVEAPAEEATSSEEAAPAAEPQA